MKHETPSEFMPAFTMKRQGQRIAPSGPTDTTARECRNTHGVDRGSLSVLSCGMGFDFDEPDIVEPADRAKQLNVLAVKSCGEQLGNVLLSICHQRCPPFCVGQLSAIHRLMTALGQRTSAPSFTGRGILPESVSRYTVLAEQFSIRATS